MPTLAGLVAVVFFISRVIPADPVACSRARRQSRAQIELLRQKLGLDRPLLGAARSTTIASCCRGDLGTSLFTTRPVSDDLLARLPATIELTHRRDADRGRVGIPLGVVSALYRNTPIDHVLRIVTVAGLAVASFWLALDAAAYFRHGLGWLPLQARITGFPPPPITGFYVVDALLGATSRGSAMRWRT